MKNASDVFARSRGAPASSPAQRQQAAFNPDPGGGPGRKRSSRLFASLLCALTALAVPSCATMDSTTAQYIGAPHFAPSDPAEVQILRREPGQPHERLGEVVVETSTEPSPPVADVEERLRREGARIGADAVVIVYDRLQPVGVTVTGGYWNQNYETLTGRRLVGVAIKYEQLTPTGAPR